MVGVAMMRGFTMIEVLSVLFLVIVGIASLAGMILWGRTLASRVQSTYTALSTAQTVLVDPSNNAVRNGTTKDFANGHTTTGYLNGHWFERRETYVRRLAGGIHAVQVEVSIYNANGGDQVAFITGDLLVGDHP